MKTFADIILSEMKISDRDPAEMKAAEINKELDQLEKRSRILTDEFIKDGRGNEKFDEIRTKKDPLAVEYIAIADRETDLRTEIKIRYGPGSPHRLPTRGFKPRKTK